MRSSTMMRISTTLTAIFLLSFSMVAQTTGEITGTVTNQQSEPVPFATVTVLAEGKVILSGKADSEGYFVLKPLNPGTYDVEITADGYELKGNAGIKVGADMVTFFRTTLQQKNIKAKARKQRK